MAVTAEKNKVHRLAAGWQETPSAGPGQQGGPGAQGGRCTACGHLNTDNTIFCAACGQPLHIAPARGQGMPNRRFNNGWSLPQMVDGIAAADWVRYLGSSATAYLRRFAWQEKNKTKLGFSLSAFFLGPFYFAYRKMYWVALSAFLLLALGTFPTIIDAMLLTANPLLNGFSPTAVQLFSDILYYATFAGTVALSIFAPYWYRQQGVRTIQGLRSRAMDEASFQINLARSGGTSLLAVLLVGVLWVLFCYIIYPMAGEDLLAFYNSLLL